jgi:hypothetical protein
VRCPSCRRSIEQSQLTYVYGEAEEGAGEGGEGAGAGGEGGEERGAGGAVRGSYSTKIVALVRALRRLPQVLIGHTASLTPY